MLFFKVVQSEHNLPKFEDFLTEAESPEIVKPDPRKLKVNRGYFHNLKGYTV